MDLFSKSVIYDGDLPLCGFNLVPQKKKIKNFCNVPLQHCGVVIADALRDCFFDWGIENKIHTIIVDNMC
jgi:hypothetical protein